MQRHWRISRFVCDPVVRRLALTRILVKLKELVSNAKVLLAGLVLVVLLLLNTWFPRLRCEWRVADYIFALVVFVSPIVLASLALSARPRRLGILVAALGFTMIPILAIGFFKAAFGFVFTALHGQDLSFLPTAEIWQGAVRVRAFQTDGGTTTDYGLWVRQERRIFPGILIVRDLHNVYHARGGSLTFIAPGVIRVTPDVTYQTEENHPVELILKPFLWK